MVSVGPAQRLQRDYVSLSADLDFSGSRVLITGAAHGIGAAMARVFAVQGATLVLADLEAAALVAVADPLGAESHVFDQGDAASIHGLAAAVGEVDVLVNNAGVLLTGPILDAPEFGVRRLMDIDVLGVIFLMQAFGRAMTRRGGGVVLNISSQTAFCGGENRGIYAAAKAAVAQVTRTAAVGWGPSGVRVLPLAPGRSLTRMTQETTRVDYTGDRGLSRVPLRRWGTAEEIAKLGVLMCSRAASYVTGETVIADGGYVVG